MHPYHRASFLIPLMFVLGCASAESEPDAKPQTPKVTLDGCLSSLKSSRQPSAREAVDACAGLWKQPTCQEAWRQALDVPRGQRADLIVMSCRAAYCSSFEVKPTICIQNGAVDLAATVPPWLDYWSDFSRMALSQDLQMEPVPELGAFGKTLLTLVVVAE